LRQGSEEERLADHPHAAGDELLADCYRRWRGAGETQRVAAVVLAASGAEKGDGAPIGRVEGLVVALHARGDLVIGAHVADTRAEPACVRAEPILRVGPELLAAHRGECGLRGLQ